MQEKRENEKNIRLSPGITYKTERTINKKQKIAREFSRKKKYLLMFRFILSLKNTYISFPYILF
jgi:hypothetical protein